VKKQFILMMIVLSALLQFACVGSVTGPDDPTKPPPPPFEEKRYTLYVKYIRINVTRPDFLWRLVGVTIYDRNAEKPLSTVLMDKKDDYLFEKQFSDILETESYGNCYYIYGQDVTRWDGVDDSSAEVGDRFILTVLETGSTLELTNILQNNLPSNPYKGPQAKMAKFCIKRDGTLTNGD